MAIPGGGENARRRVQAQIKMRPNREVVERLQRMTDVLRETVSGRNPTCPLNNEQSAVVTYAGFGSHARLV